MDHFNFKINSVFHQNQLLSPRGCCWVSMSVDAYHKSHKIQGARYNVSWEPPLCLQPKEVTITWQYRSSGQYAKNKWIYKIVKHIEKDIFCLANTQSVSSLHSGPCPCPYPPYGITSVCLSRSLSPLLHTHLFSEHFLLILVSSIWTLCINEPTFSPHVTQSLCTSSHFTNISQSCNPEGQHLELPTGRTGFSSCKKQNLQQQENHF